MDGEAPAAGVVIDEYVGTADQTANSKLAAAIPSYADTLAGIAYIVVEFPSTAYDSWPRVKANVRGKKVWNPKTSTTVYSTNPALHLGDLLSSSDYGMGYAVDDTALEASQDYCDDTSPGEVRRISHAVIDATRPTDSWVEVLRNLAGCYIVMDGDDCYVNPDKLASSVMTFTEDNIVEGSMQITKQDSSQLPTVIRVEYTDASDNEWRTRYSSPAVKVGYPVRESRVSMLGITRASQAYREAVERLNKLWLSDLTVTFNTYAEALALQIGDVITVTHGYGLTAKLLRVASVPVEVAPSIWQVLATDYDPAAYSDEVISEPSYSDGNLPSTGSPEPPTNFDYTEVTRQNRNGEFLTRAIITWDASPSNFVTGYVVRVTDDNGNEVYNANTSGLSATTPPLKELVPHSATITAYTTITTGTASLSGSINVVGKTAVPNPPSNLTGFEAGGQVRLSWGASSDVDIIHYEIRYGDTGGSFATATVLDQTDTLRATLTDLPEGTFRFYVAARDSVQQLSTAIHTDIEVTLDNDAFTAASLMPVTGNVANSGFRNIHVTQEDRLIDTRSYYALNNTPESWNTLFGGSAMSTFTNAMYTYQTVEGTPGSLDNSIWLSDDIDLVTEQSASFLSQLEIEPATVIATMGLSSDGVTYDYEAATSRTGTARYARLAVNTGGALQADKGTPFVIRDNGFFRANVVAKEETGAGTSLTSGGAKIVLSKQYAAARSLVITPQGSTALTAVYDQIDLSDSAEGDVTTFLVYIFNSAGTQVAADFLWQFKGV